MSVILTINGVSYSYPETGENFWGSQGTGWANAVTNGMLQKAGGTFTLTAEVDFGATYGLKTAYYKSQSATAAAAGIVRLGNAQHISWRNNANGADLALTVNASDNLTFNGVNIRIGLITNADVDAAAAIAFSKMAALTASRALQSGSGGVLEVSASTATELGYLSGVSSAIQTQFTGKLSLSGGTMTGSLLLNADPVSSFEAATKAYVDSAGAGLSYKASVVVATTTNGTMATAFDNASTVDGVVLTTGDRILIKDQSAPAENGIYIVAASGAPTRATDADTWAELVSAFVFVESGTANEATNWVCNVVAGGTLGVTAVTWVQQSAPGTYTADGQGLELTAMEFALELDGTTLSKGASGLKVNEIANAQVAAAAAIAVNKLAALTASRAVVSDGSGFLTQATTTATEIGYVNGVTSAIQTQVDAKIAKTLTTTRGDMIYASAANTPARLAVGTSGYIIQSDGTDPVWTNQKISFVAFQNDDATLAVPTTWTSLTLAAASLTAGSPWTRSSNVLTAIYTGIHQIIVQLSNVENTGGSDRALMVRLRNTTDSTTTATAVADMRPTLGRGAATFVLYPNISNVSKSYELQICATASGMTVTQETVSAEVSKLWRFTVERIPQ